MTSWNDIELYKRILDRADKLGFKLTGTDAYGGQDGNIYLRPKDDDTMPSYTRTASLYNGALEQVNCWLAGVAWAREYDVMIRVANPVKRDRAEQNIRNKQLIELLKKTHNVESK